MNGSPDPSHTPATAPLASAAPAPLASAAPAPLAPHYGCELPRLAPPEVPAADPYTAGELRRAFVRPHRSFELILAHWRRLAASIATGRHLGLLALLLLAIAIVGTLPFGAVLGLDRLWRVAALYLGSVLICFPSLHVFGSFLGFRSNVGQNFTLALLISAVASLFTVGFAPILWFLQATMDGTDATSQNIVRAIAIVLLILALLGGLTQLARCLWGERRLHAGGADSLLIVAWQGLLIFITCRMGIFLDLF